MNKTSTTTPTPSLEELQTARDWVAKVIATTEANLATVTNSLNGSVLDGTPYATVLILDGRELIGGRWHDFKTGAEVNGWLDFEAVPAGLCGAFLSSLEVVTARVAELKSRKRAAVAIHRRELERRQLERYERNLRTHRETLAGLEARIASIIAE